MKKISIPTKKEISITIEKFEGLIGKYLSFLNQKNFKIYYYKIIRDKRFIIITVISFFTIFAHFSTPAFYKDRWVLEKIKNQLEKEYDITFMLPNEVNYSIFPIPNFTLNNVGFAKEGRIFGQIQEMKVHLSFKKFLNKDKINIQDIHISKSKFQLFEEDIFSLIKFLDKEMNNKKLFIEDSKVFFKKNKEDEVFSILTIKKIISYFNKDSIENMINFEGNIFNNPLKVTLKNNYLTKNSILNLNFDDLDKKVNIGFNYLKNQKKIFFEILSGQFTHLGKIEFDEKTLRLKSDEVNNGKFLYNGNLNFKPFFANLEINLEKFDLKNLAHSDSLLLHLLNSKIMNNENLNYKLVINSKKIKNHRLLDDLVLRLTFDQEKFSFDNSQMVFNNDIYIRIFDSEYISKDDKNYFNGRINIKINKSNDLYKFFQTRKELRKKIENIDLKFSYDFINSKFLIERIEIDKISNNEIQNVIENFNNREIKHFRRIEIKNFFNDIVSAL